MIKSSKSILMVAVIQQTNDKMCFLVSQLFGSGAAETTDCPCNSSTSICFYLVLKNSTCVRCPKLHTQIDWQNKNPLLGFSSAQLYSVHHSPFALSSCSFLFGFVLFYPVLTLYLFLLSSLFTAVSLHSSLQSSIPFFVHLHFYVFSTPYIWPTNPQSPHYR